MDANPDFFSCTYLILKALIQFCNEKCVFETSEHVVEALLKDINRQKAKNPIFRHDFKLLMEKLETLKNVSKLNFR